MKKEKKKNLFLALGKKASLPLKNNYARSLSLSLQTWLTFAEREKTKVGWKISYFKNLSLYWYASKFLSEQT